MSFDAQKRQFLEEFGEYYGYKDAPKDIDQMRATEFKRLKEVVYLDHAGATLYSESQLESIVKDLNSTLYGNPHSQSNCSLKTTDTVGEARREVLNYFNASPKEYSVIFTSGATAALKLVGETFPWSCQSSFMYTMENHNSVLGIREYALNKGATTIAVDIQENADHGESRRSKSAIKIIQHHEQRRVEGGMSKEDPIGGVCSLFAFPSECNFSGLRFNLDLVKLIKEDTHKVLEGSPTFRGSWMILIDAAKGCATEPPDLSKYKADFVSISFYKIFGYPTGLGALIVRNEAAKLLKKTYFSGGTVAASIADIDFVKRREGIEEFFEDGTLPYLSIASILHGFRIFSTLTLPAISRHTASLATYVRKSLSAMRHENGNHVCTLYGTDEVPLERMGPIISFNLRRPDGSWFGYREVEKLASLSGIQLRTGYFCNPGACAKYLGLSHSDLLSNLEAGHVCWDDHDVLNGKPTGAIRVSFGYMSSFEDAKKFLSFIETSFLSLHSQAPSNNPFRERTTHPAIEGNGRVNEGYFLKSISIYPIKSCMGFSVDSWPLTSTGLLHDREWLLKSPTGEILTQKKVPDMCYITTFINLNLGILFVESPRCKDKLQIEVRSELFVARRDEVDVHTQRFEVLGYPNEIDIWFSNAIGRPCTLLRSSKPQSYGCSNRNRISGLRRDFVTKMNFVNEGQFLLISEESVIDLNNRLRSKLQMGFREELIQIDPSRFRPNLVVSGGEAYAEDLWRSLRIGNKNFTSLGGCNRCQMINLSFQAGTVQRSSEPLATLAAYRRVKGKILFGILLRYEDGSTGDSDTWLHVGEEVFACRD